MKKNYLMTPGPCPMPPEVGLTLARPVIHHRTGEYHAAHESVVQGLRRIFKTAGEILPFASTGTGAMESAVVNLLSPGDTAIVITGGKFAERWRDICHAYGTHVLPVEVEWGTPVDPHQVTDMLAAHPEAKAVFATLCETSTTVKHDISALAEITRSTPALLVVDAISGLTCSEFRMDEWGVDVAVAAGQKGLMIPTGLGIAAVGTPRTWDAVEKARMPRYYFDWNAARAAATKHETAWSAPASLILALQKSLDILLAEGIDRVIERHTLLGEACRAGVTALGLDLLAPYGPADGVTGVRMPEGISGTELKTIMAKKYGVQIAGGQAKLKGTIIRIGHTGYADTFDIVTALAALEMALNDLGHPVEPGAGVTAAQTVLHAGITQHTTMSNN